MNARSVHDMDDETRGRVTLAAYALAESMQENASAWDLADALDQAGLLQIEPQMCGVTEPLSDNDIDYGSEPAGWSDGMQAALMRRNPFGVALTVALGVLLILIGAWAL